MSDRQFPCNSCGANLMFTPGQQNLSCPYCQSENEIDVEDIPIVENDFVQKVRDLEENPNDDDLIEITEVKCSACAAEFSIEPNETAGECAYCATPFVLEPHTEKILKPQALLPFKITSEEGKNQFREWTTKLWFAPSKLKQYAKTCEKVKGIYLPHWTYDSDTVTSYMGSRGEYYYVTESYNDSEGNRRTRQVRRTRWWPASGAVQNTFDDILVVANESLPRKYTEELEPWDLEELVPYSEEYLSGFRSERYSVGLGDGFDIARKQVDPVIVDTIHYHIGGDEQRIHSRDSSWNDVTFKHILLPVWVSAYRFQDKVYRIVINARTGEVQGERPWSWVKIAAASIAAIGLIAGCIYLFNK